MACESLGLLNNPLFCNVAMLLIYVVVWDPDIAHVARMLGKELNRNLLFVIAISPFPIVGSFHMQKCLIQQQFVIN